MQDQSIPDALRRFILTSVQSVPYLEALLLLHAEPHKPWGVQDVARRLYIGEAQALALLTAIHEAGIAERTGPELNQFRYQPTTAELAGTIDQLARTYATNLVGVTDLIHSRVDKRAHQFANAFRLKKHEG
jgi:hypothetical protein